MGVLPLTFMDGESHESLGLDGSEKFSIPVDDSVLPLQNITVTASRKDGSTLQFEAQVRLDTPVEVEYYAMVEFYTPYSGKWQVRINLRIANLNTMKFQQCFDGET